MYIAPNSTIKLLHGVPLDPTYEHSIYFSKYSDADPAKNQRDYFNNLVKTGCVFANQTYQRHGKGKLRLEVLADNIFDCNYMMFQNTNFGSKWFYAFIIDIEYINNQVSEISYVIDSLQTWFFDFEFGDCFIERRHTEYDEWSNNCPEIYTEEEVNQFEYLAAEPHTVHDMSSMYIIALLKKKRTSTVTGQEVVSQTQLINGIPVPLGIEYSSLDTTDPSLSLQWLDAVVDAYEDGDVIAMYLCPGELLTQSDPSTAYVTQIHPSVNCTTLHGYTPKNKKMLGYPFNILQVTNNCGQNVTYKIEEFTDTTNPITFVLAGTSVTTPCAIVYPLEYRGKHIDYESSITYNSFPQLAWSGDLYKSWMAQNKTGIAAGNVQNLMNEIPSAIATGSVTAATDVGGMLAATLAISQPELALLVAAGATAAHFGAHLIGNYGTKQTVKRTPSEMYGKVLMDSINTATHRVQFDFFNMQIRAEEAKIADDYFSKFGYACKRVLKPKLKARALWTFIKTKGCVLINDHLPATDAKAICDIMDNGITFWTTSATVGVYNMANNTPLGANAE